MQVSTIFKWLFKTVVLSVVILLIFNMIVFVIVYFRLLSTSFTAYEIAIENNFIPIEEKQKMIDIMDGLETAMLHNIEFTDGSTIDDRKQYGDTVVIGVQGYFQPIIPFITKVSGLDNHNISQETRKEVEDRVLGTDPNTKGFLIKFEYNIIGLKYYADLGR